jgi:hypothetical protein
MTIVHTLREHALFDHGVRLLNLQKYFLSEKKEKLIFICCFYVVVNHFKGAFEIVLTVKIRWKKTIWAVNILY